MADYGDRLRELQGKLAGKKHLETRAAELRAQQRELTEKVWKLDSVRRTEQADVEKLEGRSLAAFFYAVVGKKEELLDRERQEAYAAAVKYDTAARELADVQEALRACEAELQQLRSDKAEYAALKRSAAEAIRAAGNEAAETLLRLETEIAALQQQEKELREAITAGEGALRIAERVLESLDSAKGWGTWDMVGGGLITDAIKHSHIDEAQSRVEQLQVQLRRFKTELADVTIYANIHVEIDSFLRFADYFFDGIFSAWTVLSRINDARVQVMETQRQIRQVLARLDNLYRAAQQSTAEKRREHEAHILRS